MTSCGPENPIKVLCSDSLCVGCLQGQATFVCLNGIAARTSFKFQYENCRNDSEINIRSAS